MGRTRVVRNVTNNRLENANGRLKDRVHHFGTLEHAIQKVSRQAEWFMREVGMQISQFQTVRTILLRFFSLLPNPPTTDIALQLTGKGVPLTLVHNTPPTALDGLRKQMNRVVHKLWGLEPRRATPTFKQLIARGQILLRQGSKSATDVLPSVVEDNTPESRWRSRDTDFGFCVLCERPITTSDCWGATDRVPYLADCGDSEPCPLCGNDLRPVPKIRSAVRYDQRRIHVVNLSTSRSSQRNSQDITEHCYLATNLHDSSPIPNAVYAISTGNSKYRATLVYRNGTSANYHPQGPRRFYNVQGIISAVKLSESSVHWE
ncbi:hypothetical protein CLF_105187 [Clonorchis sinensis]|uniref:Uncharacterized protein n=1 Tax=Clonorchis sinensis TaxID=79923 RepID=G7YD55_CLOSI|nr:hypothetical protein CLF_105187 [Clonorchis sinensis]